MNNGKQLASVRLETFYRCPSLYFLILLFIGSFVIGSGLFQFFSMYNGASWITRDCTIVNITKPEIYLPLSSNSSEFYATRLVLHINETESADGTFILTTFDAFTCIEPSYESSLNCTADRNYTISQVTKCAKNRAGTLYQQQHFVLLDSLFLDTSRVQYFMPLIATLGITLPVLLCCSLAGSLLFYFAHFTSSSSKLSYFSYMKRVGSSCGRKLNPIDLPFEGMSLVPRRFKLLLTHVMNILNEKESVIWAQSPPFYKILFVEIFSKISWIFLVLALGSALITGIVCIWVYPAFIFVLIGLFSVPCGYMLLNLLVRSFYTFYVLTSVQMIVIQGDLFGWIVYRIKTSQLQDIQVIKDKKKSNSKKQIQNAEQLDDDEGEDGEKAASSGTLFFARTDFPRLKIGFEYISNVEIVKGLLEDKMNYDATRQELFGDEL